MKPAPFDYERPTSLDAVLTLLSTRRGQAKIIAGGQSLVPMMNFRMARPELLVDINRVRDLDYHRRGWRPAEDRRPLPPRDHAGIQSRPTGLSADA